MQMGLIESFFLFKPATGTFFYHKSSSVYTIYNNAILIQVRCPDDYRQWLMSMFSLFGTKFVNIYCWPMWRVETTSQEEQVQEQQARDKQPTQVCTLL